VASNVAGEVREQMGRGLVHQFFVLRYILHVPSRVKRLMILHNNNEVRQVKFQGQIGFVISCYSSEL
jgi:hypothetical protein